MTDHTQHWSEDVRRLNPELVPDVNRAIRAKDHAAVTRERRAVTASEHDEQVALFSWAALEANRTPELDLLYAVPNGGHRHPAVAAKMVAEGTKAGYPDIGLDVARGCYHGARIEMKVGRNQPTDEQLWWIDRLHREGYFCALCWGMEQARDVLEWYLSLEAT